MRYIDTGSRDPDQALGTWLGACIEADPSVDGLRWQSGFFSVDSLGYFVPLLDQLRHADGLTRILVGSNEGQTTRADIEALLALVGSPRPELRVGVVHFDNAYYHPKTVHITRRDGSEASYVGSANLTGSGVASLHIEAGLLLDTRDGDAPGVLTEISAAVDWWFAQPRSGLHVVEAAADLDRLVEAGVLNVLRPVIPRPGGGAPKVPGGPPTARLTPLLAPPPLPRGITPVPAPVVVAAPPGVPAVVPAAGGRSRQPRAAPPAVAATSWGKPLTRSDAQRKRGGNQRGSITLVQAGYPINPQTYFRRTFFGGARWAARVTRTGEPIEIALVPHDVTFLGNHLGVLDMEVSYAPNREAAQANYTTLLHLGPLAAHFMRYDVTGHRIELTRAGANYSLTIT